MKARRQYNYSVHILKPMPLTQYCTYANMCTIMNYLQVPSSDTKEEERSIEKERWIKRTV
jgi:hypothetical protein